MYQFPNDLDNADKLLTLVGSFWSDTYQGSDFVASLLHAKAQHHAQLHLNFLELLAAVSRFTLPVFHRENWSLLLLRESQRNTPNLPKLDGTYTFESGLVYGQPVETPLFAYPIPSDLVDVRVVMNSIANPRVTYAAGCDFVIRDNAIWFRTDPFSDPGVDIREEYENNEVVDRVAGVWAYCGDLDWDTVYRQFGYAIGLRMRSSPEYLRLVNAVLDALVEGTTVRATQDFLMACCDVPLAKGTETVVQIDDDGRYLWIVTDGNAYRFSRSAVPLVSVGEQVEAGQSLTDALLFFDFNCGVTPDEIRAFAAGRGLLGAGFFQELLFENKMVPLVIEEEVDGYTKVSFELGGWPGDVERFWRETHERGVASGKTLAMCLDLRDEENKTSQPTALVMPTQINPLSFLVEHVFRGGGFAVVVRPTKFGPAALGLSAARLLRKVIPPQTLCLLFVTLEATGDQVTIDGPADESGPGVSETVGSYQGLSYSETADPAVLVVENVRGYRIDGGCR